MNNIHGITSENLLRTLPDVLRNDESMIAVASSVAAALSARPEEIESLMIYTQIDSLSDELLDILAYDFKVDWWDANYTLSEKRQTLKDAWKVHRTLGTKAAVEKAISAIYSNTQVKEWFEYDGPPFHFTLLIDATYEHVDPTKHQRVLDRLNYYKNLRSTPFVVEYTANPQGNCTSYAAAAIVGVAYEISVEVSVYGVG